MWEQGYGLYEDVKCLAIYSHLSPISLTRKQMDNDYKLVGEGICTDQRRQEYDFTITALAPWEPPHACAEKCLPSNVATAEGSEGLTNFRGFMISQFDDSIRFVPFPLPLIEGRTEDNNPTRRHLLKGSSTASNPKKDDQSRRQLFYGQECYCYYDNGILEDFDWEPPAGPPMGYPPMESPLLVEGISPMESPQYIESFQNVKPIINEEIFFGINNELGYGPGYLDFDDIETEFNGTGKITFATPPEDLYSEEEGERESIGEEIIFLGPEQTFHCYEYVSNVYPYTLIAHHLRFRPHPF